MFYYTYMNVHDITFEIILYLLILFSSSVITLNIYYETL